MNENMLVSTAIMSSLWEKQQKDSLDLLIPFVKYSIAKTTREQSVIDVSKFTKYFINEFGYDTIPSHVITILLNRLCPKVLRKDHGQYTLICSLDSEVTSFDKTRTLSKEHRAKVGTSLAQYLNENISPKKGNYDEMKALGALIDFFVTNGICIIKETEYLSAIRSRDNKLSYCIAQFILHESANRTEVFDYIIDMVKGFFVSTAISIQPQATSTVTKAKFHNLNCYLDTRVIINALGMHLPEECKAAKELLKMLQDNKAQLFCFEHTVKEITDIIDAYKACLNNPLKNYSHHTLEGFDEQNYKVNDVESYKKLLRNKISALGITIVDTPTLPEIKDYPLAYNELIDYIDNNMHYTNKNAIEKDVDSVAGIMILRGSLLPESIEHSRFLFITQNVHLTRAVNHFLKKQIRDSVSPIITDIDLSSVVWLKSYSTNKDYPKTKLLENAMVTLEPTQTLLNTFFEKVDILRASGGITDDEAAIIRTDLFCKRELVKTVQGEPKDVNEATVTSIRNRLKERYVSDSKATADLNMKNYLDQKEKNSALIRNAISVIDDCGQKAFDKTKKALKFVVWVIQIIITGLFIATLVISYTESSIFLVGSVITFIIGLAGFYDMCSSRKKWIEKWINRISTNKRNKVMDVKKDEYSKILGEISQNI